MHTTKDDQIRIHLGANSRPISFEYYTENQGTQQTTSATYYYHYDLHGNVIRVTNSSGTTVIQYTYDQLGSIVSQTNSSNIYNPFTYMGEAQVIHDDEFDTSGSTPKTGLYSSGSGYYNPHTGTFLGGSGAPASANPTSSSAEEPTAQSTRPAGQLGAHAAIAAVGGGVPSTKTVAASTDVEPEPAATGGPEIIDAGPIQCTSGYVAKTPMEQWAEDEKKRQLDEWKKKYNDAFDEYWDLGEEWRKDYREKNPPKPGPKIAPIEGFGDPGQAARDRIDNWDEIKEPVKELIRKDYRATHQTPGIAQMKDPDLDKLICKMLEWAAWGYVDKDIPDPNDNSRYTVTHGYYLFGYQLKNEGVRVFWGPGEPSHMYAGDQTGKPFDDSTITDNGPRGQAGAWWKSWFTQDMQGKIAFHSVSNVGDVRVGVVGRSNKMGTENGPSGYDYFDLYSFDISGGTVRGVGSGLPQASGYMKYNEDLRKWEFLMISRESYIAMDALSLQNASIVLCLVFKSNSMNAFYAGNKRSNLDKSEYLGIYKQFLGFTP